MQSKNCFEGIINHLTLVKTAIILRKSNIHQVGTLTKYESCFFFTDLQHSETAANLFTTRSRQMTHNEAV